jgi:hypothetical protein
VLENSNGECEVDMVEMRCRIKRTRGRDRSTAPMRWSLEQSGIACRVPNHDDRMHILSIRPLGLKRLATRVGMLYSTTAMASQRNDF